MPKRPAAATLEQSAPTRERAPGQMEYWAAWYPAAASTGLLMARGFLEHTETLLVHAAPDPVTVEVFDKDGSHVAWGKELRRTGESPMCRLIRQGSEITREDFWPCPADLGMPVMLAGGEVGILVEWWHSEDRKEWRWRVEYYNSTRSQERDSWAR